MAIHCDNTPGLPGEALSEIRDMLMLALDASLRLHYSQSKREARSCVRAALRHTERLIGGGWHDCPQS